MLEDVPVVEWDRFVVEDHNGTQCVKVYGWIDRDEDDYKDFVLASFWPENADVGFTTSSDQWSEYLHHEWIGGEPGEHNPCRRVEDAFDVSNCVELHEDTALDEFATDGGQAERPDPEDDPFACSLCGEYLCSAKRVSGEEYCDSCQRELGATSPLRRCLNCGREAAEKHMNTIDISPEDEHYPEMRHLCRDCSSDDDEMNTSIEGSNDE